MEKFRKPCIGQYRDYDLNECDSILGMSRDLSVCYLPHGGGKLLWSRISCRRVLLMFTTLHVVTSQNTETFRHFLFYPFVRTAFGIYSDIQ
jgi:hypothetical protein